LAIAVAGMAGNAMAQSEIKIGEINSYSLLPAFTEPYRKGWQLAVEEVNAAGGINGKKVNLVIQDDSAEPSKAASNAKKLLTQDNAVLMINASLSSTYAPTINEAKNAGVPLLFAASVCPKDTYPPAVEGLFCTTAFASNFDSRAALAFIKETAKEPVKIGFSAMAIPISRSEMEYAVEYSKTLGMTPVGHQIIPPPTPDYTPFATKLKEADPNWMCSWAPWVTEVRTFEALRRLDWQGEYITIAHLEAESELPRIKDAKFYVMGANSLFEENLPIHKEIIEASKAGNAKYPANQMTEGWLGGLVIEAALRKVGWPADPMKLAAALNDLKVDTKGLRGVPLVWTKDNHFRTQQAYRIHRWDTGKSAITRVKDWIVYDVK
jgi:ABC-type branched-subunit amino acid transport system substrate-binding protein